MEACYFASLLKSYSDKKASELLYPIWVDSIPDRTHRLLKNTNVRYGIPPDFSAREAAESFNIIQAIVIHLGCAPEI